MDLRGLVPVAVLLVGWEAVSRSGLTDPRIVPPLEGLLGLLRVEVAQQSLLANLAASVVRDLTGFAVGASIGVAGGVLLGLSPLASVLLRPSFDVFRQIALFAWIPLIAMWFGIGEASKIVFVALAAFTPTLINTVEGTRSASAKLVEVGTLLRYRRWQMLHAIYLPAALPSILTGVHLALIQSWLATIGAEYFMTAGPGIGTLIIEGRDRFQMGQTVLGMILIGVVGFLLNRIARAAEHWLLRWRVA
jgi:sulfonate transport system permease protein